MTAFSLMYMSAVPASPSECSALPVYNSTGDVNAVDLTWGSVIVSLVLRLLYNVDYVL